MQKQEIKTELIKINNQKEDILSMIDLEQLNNNVKTLDQQTYEQGFWDDQKTAQTIIKELKTLKNKQEKIQNFHKIIVD